MLISVVIPVYNGEKYLLECLESVKACPSDDIECIIINDGSKDETQKLCEQFVSGDSRFNLINKENSGVSDTRNMGIEKASGEYIFFLDIDDYIEIKQWQKILERAFEKKYDMVAYGYYNLFADGRKTTGERFPDKCDVRLAVLSTTLLNTCWGKLLRRDVILNNNIRFKKELKTCEDAIFIIDFVQNIGNVLLDNTQILYYRIHSESVMKTMKLDNKLMDFALLAERRKTYLAANYDESAKHAMYRQFFSVITDLFRSSAKKRKISDISKIYKSSMEVAVVESIIFEAKREYLLTFYKRFEHRLMRGRHYTLLALYFKIKGWL